MPLWAKGSALPQQAEPARKPHTKMQRTKAQVPASEKSLNLNNKKQPSAFKV